MTDSRSGSNTSQIPHPQPHPHSAQSTHTPLAQTPLAQAPLTTPQPLPYALRQFLAQTAALRFHEMIDMINLSAGRITSLEYWQRCMAQVFAPDAVIRYSKTSSSTEVRRFDFLVPLVPVLFVTLGRLGVVRIAVLSQELRTQLLSNGSIFFDCPRCTFTYHYPDGSYITHFVQLQGIFNSQMRIEWGDLHMHSFVPGVEWNALERLVRSDSSLQLFPQTDNGSDGNNNSNNHNDTLAKLRSHFSVFRNVSVFGSQEGLMRVMQVSTVMSSLRNIWMYQRLHGVKSPLRAMHMFVDENKQFLNREGDAGEPASKKRKMSNVSPRGTLG